MARLQSSPAAHRGCATATSPTAAPAAPACRHPTVVADVQEVEGQGREGAVRAEGVGSAVWNPKPRRERGEGEEEAALVGEASVM